MEAYKTIVIKSKNCNNKSFNTQIKNQFEKSSDVVKKKQLKRNKTNINSEKRPKLIKNRIQKKYLINELELGKELEKIGNDDIMFINDNLITNIKIEPFIKGKKHSVMSCDGNLIKKDDKNKYTSNYHKISNKQKNNYYTKNNSSLDLYSLDLNCNKMSYSHEKKLINIKKQQ